MNLLESLRAVLRYAIERLSIETRADYLARASKVRRVANQNHRCSELTPQK